MHSQPLLVWKKSIKLILSNLSYYTVCVITYLSCGPLWTGQHNWPFWLSLTRRIMENKLLVFPDPAASPSLPVTLPCRSAAP